MRRRLADSAVAVCVVAVALCAAATIEPCEDHDSSCVGWAEKGECEANKAFMESSCRKSCGLCDGGNARESQAVLDSPPPPAPQKKPTGASEPCSHFRQRAMLYYVERDCVCSNGNGYAVLR